MRLDSPTGSLLLLLPCLFSIAVAAKQLPNVPATIFGTMVFLFTVGAILMRSAGCVLNDLLDSKIDAKISRTKSRPLVSGEVTKKAALTLLVILLSISLLILLQFNIETIFAGCFALLMVVLYPLMKRVTYYPQLFLGLVFNFGILMAYLAIMGQLTYPIFTLYAAAVLWTVIYDTVYGYQDIEDDIKVGVKSTSIKFKKNPQKILVILSMVMFFLLMLFGWQLKYQPGFFIMVLVADLFLNSKIRKCDFGNPKHCAKFFRFNIWFGVMILTAIILG